jgi:hypothetical protein
MPIMTQTMILIAKMGSQTDSVYNGTVKSPIKSTVKAPSTLGVGSRIGVPIPAVMYWFRKPLKLLVIEVIQV